MIRDGIAASSRPAVRVAGGVGKLCAALLAGLSAGASLGVAPGYATHRHAVPVFTAVAGVTAAEHQDRLDRALQRILDTVAGPGRSTVTTNVELDLAEAVTTSTTYTAGPAVSVLLERISRRSYTADGGATRYESTSVARVNALDELRETRREAPGGIAGVTVAVLIDETAAKGLDLEQVRELVGVAAGIDARRGDRVTIAALPMHTGPATRADSPLPPSGTGRDTAPRVTAVAAALILLILGVVLAFRRHRRKADTGPQEPLRAELARLREPIVATGRITPIIAPSRDGRERERAVELVAPDQAAAQLRGWLGRDG
jgi:flagellar M-ring protein FliF